MIPSWKFYQTQWLTSMNSTFSWILIHPFSSGFGLSTVLLNYHNIQNIIYSLLTGRPVVVIGSAQFEEEIRGIVLAPKLLVPGCHRYVWSWLPFVFGYILFKCKIKTKSCRGETRKLEILKNEWKLWISKRGNPGSKTGSEPCKLPRTNNRNKNKTKNTHQDQQHELHKNIDELWWSMRENVHESI